jgi:hypothetical protein
MILIYIFTKIETCLIHTFTKIGINQWCDGKHSEYINKHQNRTRRTNGAMENTTIQRARYNGNPKNQKKHTAKLLHCQHQKHEKLTA